METVFALMLVVAAPQTQADAQPADPASAAQDAEARRAYEARKAEEQRSSAMESERGDDGDARRAMQCAVARERQKMAAALSARRAVTSQRQESAADCATCKPPECD